MLRLKLEAAREPGRRPSKRTTDLANIQRLLEEHPERVGYLLKDRVSDLTGFADAVRRIAAGEVVIDPEIQIEPR